MIAHLRETEGFQPYALMLENNGFASREVIDGVVNHMRSQRMTSGKTITTDDVRHDVKDYFRPRVMARLLDPALSAQASWQQMRKLLDELPGPDRGPLVEEWYRGRHLAGATGQISVGVERTSGQNAGKIESRRIDAVDGNTAVEIKDVEGKIDDDQLNAYLEMIEAKLHGTQ